MKSKRLYLLMTVFSLIALTLSLSGPSGRVHAAGDYYFDFDTTAVPPTAWTAGGDSTVTGETSAIESGDNACPANGTHYDRLTQGISPDPTAGVWLVKSFPGDGSDTVTVSWKLKDKGADCSFSDPCLTGSYVGSSPPTSKGQFTLVPNFDVRDSLLWHEIPAPQVASATGSTIYVAILWRHVRGDTEAMPAMGFDCIDVKIEPNNG